MPGLFTFHYHISEKKVVQIRFHAKNDLSAKRCPFLKIFANIGRISSELISYS